MMRGVEGSFVSLVVDRGQGPQRVELERRRVEIPSCLLYTSPSPRDLSTSRMPSSA